MKRCAIAMLLLLGGCHEQEHEHGQERHGHGHGEDAVAVTHFSEHTELFVEVPPLVAGEPAELAAHVTRLSDFEPVKDGVMVVELSGGGVPAERFEARGPAVPGIFRPIVRPQHPGERSLAIRVRAGDIDVTHPAGTLTVYASEAAAEAAAAGHDETDAGEIGFSKEQQWRMDFGTAPVTRRRIRPSFEAYGTIRPRAGGEAWMTAPVAGRLAAGVAFPRVGLEVERGDVLAVLTPRLAELSDTTAVDAAVSRARIAMRQAERELERLEGLYEEGAVPEQRVIDARFEEEQARAALEAALRRQRQLRRVSSTSDERAEGAVEVRAPLGGTVVAVETTPGSFIDENERMFRVIDMQRLWLVVHVAEAHAAYLDEARGVWFEVEGFDRIFEADASAVVAAGGVLDERSRTVPLLVEVENPGGRLRVGMFADVHVLNGDPRDALALPLSAVVRESGLPVIYVQRGGESFERRPVRLGARDGDHIEVLDGVDQGERVVTRGAYAVRLAASSGEVPSHGHHH